MRGEMRVDVIVLSTQPNSAVIPIGDIGWAVERLPVVETMHLKALIKHLVDSTGVRH
jgi:hypothetical protein